MSNHPSCGPTTWAGLTPATEYPFLYQVSFLKPPELLTPRLAPLFESCHRGTVVKLAFTAGDLGHSRSVQCFWRIFDWLAEDSAFPYRFTLFARCRSSPIVSDSGGRDLLLWTCPSSRTESLSYSSIPPCQFSLFLPGIYYISGLHLTFFEAPGAHLNSFKMVNFAACSAQFLDNLDLYKKYTYTGRAAGISLGQAPPLLTLEGCYHLCGIGPEHYEWSKASSTILRWIMPMLALLVKAPFGAASPPKRTLSNTLCWIGTRIASLAYIFGI
jgi:hypothetical protein